MEKSERTESEKGIKERDFEDHEYYHDIVLFTAGAAVLMACFKRTLVFFLLKEWRAWVFVVLNLVLLAILFTSTVSTSNDKECSKNDNASAIKIERSKKIRRQRSQCWSEQVTKRQEPEDEYRKVSKRSSTSGENEEAFCGEDEIEAPRLSKEELNERAEAFILMFRQHLVLDARKCGKHLFESPERVERVKLQTCHSSAH